MKSYICQLYWHTTDPLTRLDCWKINSETLGQYVFFTCLISLFSLCIPARSVLVTPECPNSWMEIAGLVAVDWTGRTNEQRKHQHVFVYIILGEQRCTPHFGTTYLANRPIIAILWINVELISYRTLFGQHSTHSSSKILDYIKLHMKDMKLNCTHWGHNRNKTTIRQYWVQTTHHFSPRQIPFHWGCDVGGSSSHMDWGSSNSPTPPPLRTKTRILFLLWRIGQGIVVNHFSPTRAVQTAGQLSGHHLHDESYPQSQHVAKQSRLGAHVHGQIDHDLLWAVRTHKLCQTQAVVGSAPLFHSTHNNTFLCQLASVIVAD